MEFFASLVEEMSEGLIFYVFDFILTFFEALASAIISKFLLVSGEFMMFNGEEAFYYFESHVRNSLHNGNFVFMFLGVFIFGFAVKLVFQLFSAVVNLIRG